MSTTGTVLVESKRHFLDYGEMRADEGIELAALLNKLFPVIKEATNAHRVYALATMAGAPHFHLWLVPKRKGGPVSGVKYLASSHRQPTRRAALDFSNRIRKSIQTRRGT
jgi:diadenosine tetraphosphate (Ap4A) HIT family hydrolase